VHELVMKARQDSVARRPGHQQIDHSGAARVTMPAIR
jgi:hypothetical protein